MSTSYEGGGGGGAHAARAAASPWSFSRRAPLGFERTSRAQVWVSTEGSGVPFLHVRLGERCKDGPASPPPLARYPPVTPARD